MYLGIYDTQAGERVFSDTITYAEGTNAGLRMLAISDNGNRVVAGDWAGFLHYYVRSDPAGAWSRVQSIDAGSRLYWIDMDASASVTVVGTQGSGLHVYEMGDSSLTLLWKQPDPNLEHIPRGFGGGQRYGSVNRYGRVTTEAPRCGGVGGGSRDGHEQATTAAPHGAGNP